MRDAGRVSEQTMSDLSSAVQNSTAHLDSLGDEARASFGDIEIAINDVNRDFLTLGQSNGLSDLDADIDTTQGNLEDLESATQDATNEIEDLGGSNNLDDLNGDLDQTQGNLDDLQDNLGDVDDALDDVEDGLNDMGDAAVDETEQVDSAFEGLAGTAKKLVGVLVAVFAVDKIKDFFLTIVETTADLEAINDQYAQVMGGMKDTTDKYLNEMSETWNKHPNELKNSYMQYVALLKGKGVAEKEAHETAQKYMDLTVDGNAFANESMEDTTARFAAMIKGEYSSVDTAMVNLTATQLDVLAKSTLGKKFAELTTAEQELLKTNEALRQQDIAGVIGQGAREADSYANNVAMLSSTWDNFLYTYGGPAMDAANSALKMLIGLFDHAQPAMQGLADKMQPITKGFKFIKDGIDAVKEMMLGSGDMSWFEKNFGLDGAVKINNTLWDLVDIFMKVKDSMITGAGELKRYMDGVFGFLESVFQIIFPSIQPILEDVVKFAGGIFAKLKSFWDQDGEQLVQAIQNAFQFILAIIQFVMPAVLAIIKMVWGNIQGVINGAINIIMGIIKVFSGLLTGDFKKMWEGIKQLFVGAVEFIWNFIQLTFYGKILGGAKAFILAFRQGFVALWQAIVALFKGQGTAVVNHLKNAWNLMWVATKTVFTNIGSFLKTTWDSIKSITTGFINAVKLVFTNGWSFIRNTTTTTFTGIWNFLKSTWTTIKDFLSGSVTGIFTKMRDTWTALKTNTSNAFRDIFNSITSRFTDIVNAAKELPKKIGDGIGSMASKVTSGVNKVTNKLAETLGKGVNGVIGGINWVLGKIGVDSKVPEWKVPKYAKGTDGHPGGLAIVGDGRGTNAGPELIQTPDGEVSLSPAKDTLVNLPKGTQVLSAKNTKDLLGDVPKYAKGTGGIVQKAFDVFDYIKNPSKLLDVALNALGFSSPKGGSFIGDMAKGAVDKVKKGAIEFVKGKLADFGESTGKGFGPPFRKTSSYGYRIHPITGDRKMHYGDDYGAPSGTPIPAQSAGTVVQSAFNSFRGNYVRIKSGIMERIYQHNSRNSVGVGSVVKAGQTVGTVGSTGASTGPHLHYEVLRNGEYINPKGYANGGVITKEQLAWVGEGNKEEVIIPTGDASKRSNAMKLLEIASRKLGVGGVKTQSLDAPRVYKKNESQLTDVRNILAIENDEANKEIAEINKKANAEAAEIAKRSAEDIRLIHQKAKAGKRKITEAEAIRIRRIEEDSAKKIKNINIKAAADVLKITKSAQANRIGDINTYISDKRKLEQISLKDEVAIWEESVKHFKDSTDEKREAMLALRDAKRAVDQETLEDGLAQIDALKKQGQLSFENELKMLNELERHFDAVAGNSKFEAIQQRKAEIVQQVNSKIESINNDYLARTRKINDDLIAEEKRLRDEYQKTVEDRAKTIESYFSVFDRFEIGEAVMASDLMRNLNEQVAGLQQWQIAIADLSSKAIDEGLLEELRQMGPKALPELKALNSMTDDQLTAYSNMYQQKSAIAREQAEAELAGMKKDTEKRIEEMRKAANAELDVMNKEWVSKIKNIMTDTDTVLKTLKDVGINAGKVLMEGISSIEGPLMAKLKSMAQSIKREMSDALNVNITGGVGLVAQKFAAYKDGGIVDTKQLAWVADGGWAESIISHDPAKRVSQRAIWDETGKQLGFNQAEARGGIPAFPDGDLVIKLVADGRELSEIVAPWIDVLQVDDAYRDMFAKGLSR
ncbi:peptidoglycan DD-metalloendopeptidase family protein [Sporosarcina sp. FSL K6-1522]|uniref:peptidoglycan DD-metalloendopeptidase family protein n=1 Tax=Sporosarcina sp. FSL K6-1522 TaxID=2921554 RepID=UPI00315A42AB